MTFSRFRVEHSGEPPRDLKNWLARGLKARAFEPIDRKGEEERSAGFVELEKHDAVEFPPGSFLYGEYALLCYRIDQLKVSPSKLVDELDRWSQAFEKDKGRPPGRYERTEGRANIKHMLRQRASPTSRFFDVSWNLKTGELLVWAASRKPVEEVQEAVQAAFDVKLLALVPATVADQMKIPDEALAPTKELAWPGVTQAAEVSDG